MAERWFASLPIPFLLEKPKGLASFRWFYIPREDAMLMIVEYRGVKLQDKFTARDDVQKDFFKLISKMPKEIDFYFDAIW